MKNEITSKTIKTGDNIVCHAAIMGSANPNCAGWKYTMYKADCRLKSGYRYTRDLTPGMYSNKTNHAFSKDFEQNCKHIIIYGRPIQGKNAPIVIK